MTGLPAPSLTATIALLHAGAPKHALGRVTVHGYTPPERTAEPRRERTNRPQHCSRCQAEGHNSRSPGCPLRPAPASERPARVPRRAVITRSRCAARYARLVGCSMRDAALAFGISRAATSQGWSELYPDVPADPALRGAR